MRRFVFGNGRSLVFGITKNTEVEAVYYRNSKNPTSLVMYFDADMPASSGSDRPRLHIELGPDGRTPISIELIEPGGNNAMKWVRDEQRKERAGDKLLYLRRKRFG